MDAMAPVRHLRGRASVALMGIALIGSLFAPVVARAATTSFVAPSGTGGGSCATPDYNTIQAAVTAAASGDTIVVCAGTYRENVDVTQSVTIQGAGQGVTIVEPAVSNPNCGGGGGSSLCAPVSSVFVVEVDNVRITGLTVEGDNPSLTSADNVGGANIDARNGIITDYNSAPIVQNGLVVDHVTVKDVFRRGIYAASGGTFNVHDNIVSNVQGDPNSSVALFNYGGSGTFANNIVSAASDAINANHSKGTSFIGNAVSNSGSGVHTDNAGDGGGVADTISGNTVSCSPNGYGVWIFVPYLAPSVSNNTVTSCAVGLGAFGGAFSPSPTVTTVFSDNRVDGAGAIGSVGAYVWTGTYGYGNTNVDATFDHNTIVHNDTGVQVDESPDTYAGLTSSTAIATVALHYNVIAGNHTVGLTTNSAGTVDAVNNWWGCSGGPSDTANCNGVSGKVGAQPWLVDRVTIPTTVVPINSTITGSVDLTWNSDGGQPGGTVPNGTTVTFSSSPAGMTGSGTTTGGTATVSITTGSSANVYDLCAQVPTTYGAREGCTSVAVYDPSGGFVTGGGWINSPAGADVTRADGTVIVSPSNMQGWGFHDDNGNDGTGQMVTGPATPPLGSGSAELAVTASNQGYILATGAYVGTPLANITSLGYSSYQPGPTLAIALQFDVKYRPSDTGYDGRLVYEPYQNGAVTVGAGWQTWSPLNGTWWASHQGTNGTNDLCPQSSPCSWSTILADFPQATISGATLFKAGSGWTPFDGNVDAFTIGVSGTKTTYDFEPSGGPAGKATFAFVSKYLKGATVPSGHTAFVFQTGGLDFESTAYQWLVVNQGGTNAQFKGTGTINGAGTYDFMIWAGDGSPDTFRIKITDHTTGDTVYDNGTQQPIGGGSIIVHK